MKRNTFLTLLAVAVAAVFLIQWRRVEIQRPVEPATPKATDLPLASNGVAANNATAAPSSATTPTPGREPAVFAPAPASVAAWRQATTEPAFSAFAEWSQRYESAAPTAKAALEEEGTTLARKRRQQLANLIQRDPKQALELAVPNSVRDAMPEAVRALLEEYVSSRGDLQVIGVLPGQGGLAGLPSVMRSAVIGGESHEVFTYGKGLNFVTRENVPMDGIAIPAEIAGPSAARELIRPRKVMALSESPVRMLTEDQIRKMIENRVAEPICSVSQVPVSIRNDETVVQLAGDIHSFCGKVDAEAWAAAQIAGMGLETPFYPASGVPTAESSYTEGRKRMLCLRPYWTDQAVALTTNAALTHWVNFSNYMYQMSYGKLVFAPLGRGSDISADILIPGSVNNYVSGLGSGATDLWRAVRDVAATNYGYNLSQYDFIYYCTGSRPSASYAGLGFVGGVGFHLANSYFDAAVSSHEFGHNLGLNHAHFWDTAGQSIIGAGENIEYGDNNDPMGGGGNPNQYNSRYKNYLGWIPDTDIANVSTLGSGTYRLYAFDQDFGVGLRGIRYARNSSQNYWLNFRQRKTTKKALMNGVQLMWTDNGNGGSYLLDTRLRGTSDDNAIVIGRTFSDTNGIFHVTPIGKGNTYPESIDVVVRLGTQAGNLPPIANVQASSLDVPVGQSVTFTASAADPNGDTLAYYWEFGDSSDNYSADNSPTQTRSFTSAGEYTARCVVSDMRGGTSQQTLIVRVGNPSTFRISGHLVDSRNRPLAGMLVRAGGREVFSDSDGSYTIPGLPAGVYDVSAVDPLSASYTFIHPYFNNPITVGPNFNVADFIGVPGTLTIYTPLAAKASAGWRYNDQGIDLGSAWSAPGFVDTSWATGTGPLGYPSGSSISTVISFGPDSNNKYPTYYFRKQFNVANPAAYTNLLLEVLRDDSAAVYLNGNEVYRDNLPGGTLTYNTYALDNSGADTYRSLALPVSAIVAGNNVLAVEVHQVNATSSDVVMDVALSGLSASNIAGLNLAYLSSPANNSTYTTPANVPLVATVQSGSLVTRVDFYANGVNIGSSTAAPYMAALDNPSEGSHVLTAVAVLPSQNLTSPPVRIFVAAPEPPTVSQTLTDFGANWKYLASASAAPATWPTLVFNDAAWLAGPGELGFGDGDEATTVSGGPTGARFTTIYFRRKFNVVDPGSLEALALSFKRDDGIIVYLNGTEIARNNMPAGTVVYSTLAAAGADDDGEAVFSVAVDPSLLAPGTNQLAVEVHQSAIDSSDLSFDLSLAGTGSEPRARGVYLTAPTEGTVVPMPGSVGLNAQVVAGGTLGVTRVEFFADGTKVGEDTAAPFSISWTPLAAGPHAITAVGTDTEGNAIIGTGVNVTVLPPPVGEALISFGDVWKYLDDGSNQGTAWAARLFNDNSWTAGPARLGYGGDGEVTTVSFGTNANNKHITTYFRKAFVLANPGALNGLRLRLSRDDGAAVYLNGAEVYRNNLQAGAISWNSLATATADGAAEVTPLDVLLGTNGLRVGTNVVAVEVHQVNNTSSDMGFDLALTGLVSTNASEAVYLTSPADATHFNAPANVQLQAYAVAPEPVTLVEYFDGTVKIGESTTPPYQFTWLNAPMGFHALFARMTYGSGTVLVSPAATITVGSVPPPITPIFSTLLPAGSAWKYWDSATAVGDGWQTTGFNDGGWPTANARFGWGLDGEMTPLTPSRTTHYFRRWFNLADVSGLDELILALVRDDGAVVYLNGVEVFRSNMPTGPIGATTLASATVNTPDETTWYNAVIATTSAGLMGGTNLLAVELHQSSATSSDGSFDFALYGAGTTERRIYFGSPVGGRSYVVGAPIPIELFARAGTGRSISQVQLFLNGTNYGQMAAGPFKWTLPSLPLGSHALTARLFDNVGESLDAVPINITVTRELVSTTLIAAGSVWRYLDNGTSPSGWALPAFNDNTWNFGPARLGYGGDGEETTVGYGPSSTSKYITTYFRHAFVAPGNAVITNLTYRLLRDDGAVVYLNGREHFRSNMPNGTVTFTTTASAAISDAAEDTFYSTTIAITNLTVGTNVIAVEIHQNAANSSDLGFDLEVIGSGYVSAPATPPSLLVLFNGTSVVIKWPSTYTGYTLHGSTALGAGAVWSPILTAPVSVGGENVVTLNLDAPEKFFRLQR